jgi:hypothetical protein
MTSHSAFQNGVFDPEAISAMATAYEQALGTLELSDRDDRLTEIIAQRIIGLALTGVRDPGQLSGYALAGPIYPGRRPAEVPAWDAGQVREIK